MESNHYMYFKTISYIRFYLINIISICMFDKVGVGGICIRLLNRAHEFIKREGTTRRGFIVIKFLRARRARPIEVAKNVHVQQTTTARVDCAFYMCFVVRRFATLLKHTQTQRPTFSFTDGANSIHGIYGMSTQRIQGNVLTSYFNVSPVDRIYYHQL